MGTEKDRIRDRDKAILIAREIISEPYFTFDTETTDLVTNGGEICQVGLCESNGRRFLSFVKPTKEISASANAVNHITYLDVKDAPKIMELEDMIPYGKNIAIYNLGFDRGAIENSYIAWGEWFDRRRLGTAYDVMRIFASFNGEWNYYHNGYKWKKLEDAYALCNGNEHLTAHNALSDAIMTEHIIKYMASQKLSTETKE